MSVSIQPPPSTAPKKKSGLGCLGCGCAALALVAVLLIGLAGLMVYSIHKEALALTSTTPTDIPAFTGGPDVFNTAEQKGEAFQLDVKNHRASTLQLSGDELNALIANSPAATQNNIRAFVTLSGSDARVQVCLPTDKLSKGLLTGRYFSFDSTFTVAFDASTKSLILSPQTLQFGTLDLLGPGMTEAQKQQVSRSLVPVISQNLNTSLRSNPDCGEVLDHARNVEVKDGELIIETD